MLIATAKLAVAALTAVSFATAPATARAADDGSRTFVEIAKGAGITALGVATTAGGAAFAVGAGATVAMNSLTVGTALALGAGYVLIGGGVILAGYGLYRGGKALFHAIGGSNVRRDDATVPGSGASGAPVATGPARAGTPR